MPKRNTIHKSQKTRDKMGKARDSIPSLIKKKYQHKALDLMRILN